jgi:transketolase
LETTVAWATALRRTDGPSCLLLSRQTVAYLRPALDPIADAARIERGGYVFIDPPAGAPIRLVLIATGSELPLAVEAQKTLAQAGIAVRVVSMPSTTVFDRQDAAYKAGVLPHGVPRVAIEAGVTDFWWKYVRENGAVLGVDRFGESAPAPAIYREFGLTVDNLVATARAVLDHAAAPSAAAPLS